MTSSQAGDSPPLLRPIPRRPFDLNLREPTPPDDDDPFAPPVTDSERSPALNLESLNSRLLDPKNNPSSPESAPISRAQSVLNLTGSTLMGIYSHAPFGRDKFNLGTDEPGTPWGTGAETPAKGLNINNPHYQLQKERAQRTRRRSSLHPTIRPRPLSGSQRVFYMGSRGLLLSGLGVLYGMLVAQLHNRRQITTAFQVDGMLKDANGGYDWRYLAFWGASGIVMGSLLPWFDDIWERAFGREDVTIESAAEHGMGGDNAGKASTSSTEWALAVRGIGAFVGIAFAIRKLPWDSTLQVSMTLALVNPVLWFLIDRSMPGFLLSAAVGMAGAAVLMGLKPDMVPIPANPSSFGDYGQQFSNASEGGDFTEYNQHQQLELFGGLVLSQESVATGIWITSVLFCCCVCFGNIGRWLALNRGVVARGRWAERK
ncbi:insulin-induced protein-domain-containing protein [Hypoxylon crocopeplum]|nr:insulin-induced protein-domain-containing protein [Hypoxylon crocopeplum]